jgi:hypothetical protein
LNPVVILIIHHKPQLLWYEKIALLQCFRILGTHPIRLICPHGLDLTEHRAVVPELKADFIPAHCLATYEAFARRKVLPFLYRRYADYKFILMYELDAFVFRDALLEWCAKAWDYIGASWFEGYEEALPNAKPLGTGNGGFSLRRTKAMIRISQRLRYQQPAQDVVQAWRRGNISFGQLVAKLTVRNNFFAPFNDRHGPEDIFWCKVAPKRFPELRVAPHEIARQFSFEANPGRLFRESGGVLPFGCHGWMNYEPDFWARHIQQFGYTIPTSLGHTSVEH